MTHHVGASAAEGGTEPPDPSTLSLPPYADTRWPPALHFLPMMRDPIAFGDRIRDGPDVFRTRVPGQGDNYRLGHPDHIKRVLLTEREKFCKSADFDIAFGEGLLTVEGEEWQRQRNALQPLFTRDSVLGYDQRMVETIERRVDRWRDGDVLDLQAEFTDLTLDVLFATILGRELALDGDERLRRAAENLHQWFVPTSYLLPPWIPTPSRRRFERAKERLRAEADRLLAERADDPPPSPDAADDLLSLLVAVRETGGAAAGMLRDERLRDQVVTIVFAGHDTTTTSLTFACWALANHAGVRQRFHEEVDALDGPPTAADVDDMPVTDRVVTETLRLFPPVYTLPRRTTEAVAVDGYRVPADERVILPIRDVQRDARFFAHPEDFRPGRWTDDRRRELPDFAYAPFGGGPRICIGRAFALLEAKLALATIGRRFHLEWLGDDRPGGEPPVSPEMTLRMERGQQFRLEAR
jgi:cytochrome P450